MNAPTRRDFERELRTRLYAASRDEHRCELTVQAGELHRSAGGYPDNTGQTNRVPMCCSVMEAEMQNGDEIIDGPPSRQGESLTVRYRLPRTHRIATVHAATHQESP